MPILCGQKTANMPLIFSKRNCSQPYPNLKSEFIWETDASCLGLGVILSQKQMDGKLHPVSYASRALSPVEKNYGITDLEMLAVVWAVGYFWQYL